MEEKSFSNVHWIRFLLQSALIVFVFAILEVLLFRFSLEFEIYEKWASWYFPIGLRIASLLILPFRFWPALFFAGATGQAVYKILLLELPWSSFLSVFPKVFTIRNFILYSVMGGVKCWLRGRTIERVIPLFVVLCGAILYRAVSSTFLLSNPNSFYYGDIPAERKFELILTHFLGGLVGILIIVPIGYLLCWGYQNKSALLSIKSLQLLNQLLLMVGGATFIYFIQPHTLYLLRMLAILPLIWFSYRFGWLGAMSALLTINGLIMVSVYGLNEANALIESHLYIVSYALTGMVLGALFNEQKLVEAKLGEQNKQLSDTNKSLVELSNKNQSLAKKLVTIQETERKTLSQELHDEIGQSITALRTELQILNIKLDRGISKADITRLDKVSEQIYDSVYSVLNWLRPRVLDDIGLEQCLKGIFFKSKLEAAGISYQYSLKGPIGHVPDDISVTVFRICQECITNAIKHSKATSLHLCFEVEDNRASLIIRDNGVGFNTLKLNGETTFGLDGIKDRVASLGGELLIKSDSEDTFISVELTW